MEILEELRALRRDLTDLGDSVAVALPGRAKRCFLAWRWDDGELVSRTGLNHAHETLEQSESRGADGYFNPCAFAFG